MRFTGILILIGLFLISSVAIAQVKKAQQAKKTESVKDIGIQKKTPLTITEIKAFESDLAKAGKENLLKKKLPIFSPPAFLETTIDNSGTVTVTVKGGEIGREEKQKEAAELQKTLQKRQDFLNRWAKGNWTAGQNTLDKIGAAGSWYYAFANMADNGQQQPSHNSYRYPTRAELEQLCTEYYPNKGQTGVWYGVTEEFARTATFSKTNGCVFFPNGGILLGGQPSSTGMAYSWSSDRVDNRQYAYNLMVGSWYFPSDYYQNHVQLKVRFIKK